MTFSSPQTSVLDAYVRGPRGPLHRRVQRAQVLRALPRLRPRVRGLPRGHPTRQHVHQ